MSMCEAAFDLGPQVDQAGMFALAEERFTSAITAAQGSQQPALVNAAYVGRARVRLFMGNKTGAAADAQLVPKGFVLNASNDATDNRLYNRIFAITQQFGFYTIEGSSRDLKTEAGESDPRASVKQTATRAADARATIFVPNKYAAGDAAPDACRELRGGAAHPGRGARRRDGGGGHQRAARGGRPAAVQRRHGRGIDSGADHR